MVRSQKEKHEHQEFLKERFQNGNDPRHISSFAVGVTYFICNVWHDIYACMCVHLAFGCAPGNAFLGTYPSLHLPRERGPTRQFCLHGWRMRWKLLNLALNIYLPGSHYPLEKCMHPTAAQECQSPLFKMLEYTVRSSNCLYRLLHWRGLWLSPADNQYAADAFKGMTVSCFILVCRNLPSRSNEQKFLLDICHCVCGMCVVHTKWAQEGYVSLASMCHAQKLNLFYIRPKIHMSSHEGFLAYNWFCCEGWAF